MNQTPPTAIAISDYDAAHVGAILGDPSRDSYSDLLLILVAKADREQREVLRSVYPSHVVAYEAWFGGLS